ncbi:hypothetical protein [Bacteroides acidifaciens]|uniref:hypothetical protein n=1 Tax=Bacteroides acidifaciens TaxID=85831 RepID=UPI00261C8940|nr:hypothetical protein [Bacteroides acidifaciens]
MAKKSSSFHMGDEFNGSGKKTYLRATQHNKYKLLPQENVRLTPDYKQCVPKVIGALPLIMAAVKASANSMLKAVGAIPDVSQVIITRDKRTGKYQTSFAVRKIQLTTGAYLHKIPKPYKDILPIKDFAHKSIYRSDDDFSDLDRYVSEEIFEKMGWNVEIFKKTYGDDVIDKLKEYMYQYGITNSHSICMLLATLGTESGDGSALLENRSTFDKLTYRENTKGAGLMQVTGFDQKEFLEYLENEMMRPDSKREDKYLLTKVQEYLEGYPDPFPTVIINGKEKKVCVNSKDVAGFIAEYYPLESAAWYWGTYEKCTYWEDINTSESTNGESISLNQYVCNIVENSDANDVDSMILKQEPPWENLFLATQYYVNGSPWKRSRLQKIAECMDDTYVLTNGKLTFTLPQGDPKQGTYTERLPNNWGERAEDWEQLTYEIYG